MKKGKASIEFRKKPRILGASSVVGPKEGEGPLGKLFDQVEQDDKFGKKTWEEAETTKTGRVNWQSRVSSTRMVISRLRNICISATAS